MSVGGTSNNANNWLALASELCTSHHQVCHSGVHFANASLLLETQGKTALLQTNQNGIFLEQHSVAMRGFVGSD
jgi:hypothetical protein